METPKKFPEFLADQVEREDEVGEFARYFVSVEDFPTFPSFKDLCHGLAARGKSEHCEAAQDAVNEYESFRTEEVNRIATESAEQAEAEKAEKEAAEAEAAAKALEEDKARVSIDVRADKLRKQDEFDAKKAAEIQAEREAGEAEFLEKEKAVQAAKLAEVQAEEAAEGSADPVVAPVPDADPDPDPEDTAEEAPDESDG